MRHFHKKNNLYYRPSINIDRLWSLVPEEVYAKAKAGSEEAPIIDVTKLVGVVSLVIIISFFSMSGLFQGAWQGPFTRNSSYCQSQVLQQRRK